MSGRNLDFHLGEQLLRKLAEDGPLKRLMNFFYAKFFPNLFLVEMGNINGLRAQKFAFLRCRSSAPVDELFERSKHPITKFDYSEYIVWSVLLLDWASAVLGGGRLLRLNAMRCSISALRRNISPDCEIIRMDESNEAFERAERSDVRHRFVIDMASLSAPFSA